MYASRTLEDGETVSTEVGEFTADVSLEADFDAGDGAGTISGVASNFRDEDGDAMEEGWRVALQSAEIGSLSFRGGEVGAAFGDTSTELAGETGDGQWSGYFLRSENENLPAGVAGRFNADSETAHVAGAHGARMQ